MRFNNIIESGATVRDENGNVNMIDTGFYNSDPDPNANSYNGNSTLLRKCWRRAQLAKWQKAPAYLQMSKQTVNG